MENVLPFLGQFRKARENHKKAVEGKRAHQEAASRPALQTISNRSNNVQPSNVPTAKRRRINDVGDKENATRPAVKGVKASIRVRTTRPKKDANKGEQKSSSPLKSSQESVLSTTSGSQISSQESNAEEERIELNFFLENDFALALARANPSEMIFEVPEYVVDIYFKEQERELLPNNILLDFFNESLPPGVFGPELVRQTQISKEILTIVIDWMVEVQENMEMNHETFYLAVIMMYRYMSVEAGVSKKTIQLLACTSMWLASKYEERVAPGVNDFMYICDDAFTARDFILMEQKLFFTLNQTCHRPISYVFLRRYSRIVNGDNMKMQFLSRYFLELSLQKHSLMLNRESLKAAGALWLARATLRFSDEERWPSMLRFFTRYEESDLFDFVLDLCAFAKEVARASQKTTFVKYSNKVFLEVATIPLLPDHDLQRITKSAV